MGDAGIRKRYEAVDDGHELECSTVRGGGGSVSWARRFGCGFAGDWVGAEHHRARVEGVLMALPCPRVWFDVPGVAADR